MSTNLHIDDIGNLILRDGKLGLCVSSQNATPPHYGGGRVGALSPYAVEQVNHYYPYGGLFAESTGGEMQAFKYNGKELDRVCGLNWYDHGARHNDAAIGRWHCIDPQAASFYDTNPYCYCLNNPVNCVDEDGECPLWLVTCSVGAIAGAVISGSIALYEGKSGREVMAAAAGGAVAGAIAGTGAGLITEFSIAGLSAVSVSAGASALGSGTGNFVEQGLAKGFDNVDTKEVGKNAIVGACVGAGTGIIGNKVSSFATKTKTMLESSFEADVAVQTQELKALQNAGQTFMSKDGVKGLTNSELKGKATSIVTQRNDATNQFLQKGLPILGTADPTNPILQKTINDNYK